MKTKKMLSFLLACALLFSLGSVAAFADDPDLTFEIGVLSTYSRNIFGNITSTYADMESYGGSNLYRVTPGSSVYIAVTMRKSVAPYTLTTMQNEVEYDSGFFDSVTVNAAQNADATADTRMGGQKIVKISALTRTYSSTDHLVCVFQLHVRGDLANGLSSTIRSSELAASVGGEPISVASKNLILYTGSEYVPSVEVRFNPAGGSMDAEANLTAAVGSEIDLSSYAPARDGYEFLGWSNGGETLYTDSYPVTGSVTLTARWAPLYTVSFAPNGGALASGAESSVTVAEGKSVVLPSATRSGYTFSGWSPDGGTTLYSAGEEYEVTGTATLSAQWTAVAHTVTFDANGGVVNGVALYTQEANEGSAISLPTASRDGHRFDGWYYNNKTYGTGTVFTVTGDVTLVAVWHDHTARVRTNYLNNFDGTHQKTVSCWDDGYVLNETTEQHTMVGGVCVKCGWRDASSSGGGVAGGGGTTEILEEAAPLSSGALEASLRNPTAGAAVSVDYDNDGNIVVTVTDASGKTLSSVDGGAIVAAYNVVDGQVVALLDETGAVKEYIKKSIVDNGVAYALLDGSATIKIVDNAKTFADVTEDSWFKNYVDFASSHGLFNGVSATEFGPNTQMNRAMLVTVLHRLENLPASSAASVFSDVGTSYYTDAVQWAASNGIVTGYGDGTFLPDRSITRQEMAVILYRYMEKTGYDVSARADFSAFGDGDTVAGWASDAMQWAIGAGIITGKPGGLIDPAGTATRAEVATMLQRVVTAMVK